MIILRFLNTECPWGAIIPPPSLPPLQNTQAVFWVTVNAKSCNGSTDFGGIHLHIGCTLKVRRMCMCRNSLCCGSLAQILGCFAEAAAWNGALTAAQRESACTWISCTPGRGASWAWAFAMPLPNLVCSFLETQVNSISVCHNWCLFFSPGWQLSALASSVPAAGSSQQQGVFSFRVNSAVCVNGSLGLFALLLNPL